MCRHLQSSIARRWVRSVLSTVGSPACTSSTIAPRQSSQRAATMTRVSGNQTVHSTSMGALVTYSRWPIILSSSIA